MSEDHSISFGPRLLSGRGTRFTLWAPDAAHVDLAIDTAAEPATHRMRRDADGWHHLTLADAGPGTRYRFRLPDGLVVPDPASRFNPLDVDGPSEVIDPAAYAWRDSAWRGRPWLEAVVYELHIGAFTPAGTYRSALPRLDELAALGITVVELMPLAEFHGRRSWGYDGVLLFAPDASYGTPDELKAFVDHAHALGISVLLDVVYNHLGPQGNYLPAYSKAFFNDAHRTPWGAAINFDAAHSEIVREFFVGNALMWVSDYHFDGLRIDAVHAIRDDSPVDIVAEIGRALREGPGRDRHVHLVLENDSNQASRLNHHAGTEMATATAQWNDDFHHAAHVLLTGETQTYYADYAATPLAMLGRALAEGFVFQGGPSKTGAAVPGEPSGHLASCAFVAFLQNHDQIGNRAFGDRLHLAVEPARLEAMIACLLLSPQVPMMFMGEEYAASTPFLYFCDYDGELAEAVREGRQREFAFAADATTADAPAVPDPTAESTFLASKLRWEERQRSPHRERLALVAELLALRARHLVPCLPAQRGGGTWSLDQAALTVDWPLGTAGVWQLRVNFGEWPATMARPAGQEVYSRGVASPAVSSLTLAPSGVWVGLRAPDEPSR